MNRKREIYLDNAATTPADPAVFAKMKPYFVERYGNASSVHQKGEEARRAVEKSRQQAADFLGCLSEEIYFTSGATESDNWAIKGIVKKGDHVITSAIEHKAVLAPCRDLAEKGLIDLTVLGVNQDGLVETEELKKSIGRKTRLISIMYANSEIGTIQPVKEISRLIKPPIVFHTDAVQAINYLDCRVDLLGVDCLSLSGHKIYGPKGVGILYIRKGTAVDPLLIGGGHERGKRSGTENVAGIVGLGEAIKKIQETRNKVPTIKKLRNKLITGVLKEIPDSQLNGSLKYRLPNNAHFSFKGAEGEGIIFELSQKGIFASTGSACASHSLKPSGVLSALGLPDELSHSSVRFTLGKDTTSKDIDYVLEILPKIVERLRKIAGYKHV